MDSPVNQRALIIGGGVVGNVFALLLKQKGWQPIILEKVRKIGVSGLALVLQSNGLKVLDKAGVVDIALEGTLPWKVWNDWSHKGEFLGGPGSQSVAEYSDRYGWPAVGLSRSKLQVGLKNACEKAGIPFLEGWRLDHIKVDNSVVTIVSDDGRELSGAFVVGADGLKSATRKAIFARHGHTDKEACFTGIEVIGGSSPSPIYLKERQGANLFWGPLETIITHPLENGTHVWGATVPASESAHESWRILSSEEVLSAKQTYLARWKTWHPVISELIQSATRIQSIGLFDRGDLKVDHWFHDRMTLIGDAAHPMTPHAGQGANQAIEDAWTLFDNLPAYNAENPVPTEELNKIFQAVAEERQPRTSAIMHKALKWGKDRVLQGTRASEEGERARNNALIKKWNDVKTLRQEQDEFLMYPFEDKGGYQRWKEGRDMANAA